MTPNHSQLIMRPKSGPAVTTTEGVSQITTKKNVLIKSEDPYPFSCGICGLSFERNVLLGQHIKSTHVKAVQVITSGRVKVVRHIKSGQVIAVRQAQLKPKPVKRIHRRTVVSLSEELPVSILNPYSCSNSNESGVSTDQYTIRQPQGHLQKQHGEDFCHTCPTCQSKFLSRVHLILHIQGTHRETLFPCSSCHLIFKYKKCHTRHVNKPCTGIVLPKRSSNKEVKRKKKLSPAEPEWILPDCDSGNEDDTVKCEEDSELPLLSWIVRNSSEPETCTSHVPQTNDCVQEPSFLNFGRVPYEKPSISYLDLIAWALKRSGRPSLHVTEIFQLISDEFPSFRDTSIDWKNSIRLALCTHNAFEEVQPRSTKGSRWFLKSSYKEVFDQRFMKQEKMFKNSHLSPVSLVE